MMTELNSDIKRTAQYYGVTQRQIANYVGIGEATLTRWLREENMSPKRKAELFNAIEILRLKNK